jgi:protein-tyrosine-phosphatase
MKILFICRHNRFRSKVAEAFFMQYDKKDEARSRGIIEDIDVAGSVVRVMEEFGVELRDETSRVLEDKDVEWADLIVIVADNVKSSDLIRTFDHPKKAKKLFSDVELDVKGKKVLKWEIPDTNQENIDEIRRIIREIKGKVKELVAGLDKKV